MADSATNEMFRKECEAIGFSYDQFPFDFPNGGRIRWNEIIGAMMFILKLRQDKMLKDR